MGGTRMPGVDNPHGKGNHLEIEVVGYGKSRVEVEQGYAAFVEEGERGRECTIVCLHIANNTSTTWDLKTPELSVTSTEGFANSESLHLKSGTKSKISPWEDGSYCELPPDSKSRVVLVYPEVFKPQKVEYDMDLLHTDLSQNSGHERITVLISKAQRKKIHALPESLPIESEGKEDKKQGEGGESEDKSTDEKDDYEKIESDIDDSEELLDTAEDALEEGDHGTALEKVEQLNAKIEELPEEISEYGMEERVQGLQNRCNSLVDKLQSW
jgi:hypothetical protein